MSISEERKNELYSLWSQFWGLIYALWATRSPENWRDNLTQEEREMIAEWDAATNAKVEDLIRDIRALGGFS